MGMVAERTTLFFDRTLKVAQSQVAYTQFQKDSRRFLLLIENWEDS